MKCPNDECNAYGACGHHGPGGSCLGEPQPQPQPQGFAYRGVAEVTPWGAIEIWAPGDVLDDSLRRRLNKAITTQLYNAAEHAFSAEKVEQDLLDLLASQVAFESAAQGLTFNVKIGDRTACALTIRLPLQR